MQWKFVYEALCLAVELCMEYMLPQVEWKRSSGATTIRIDSLQPVLYVCMYVCTYMYVYVLYVKFGCFRGVVRSSYGAVIGYTV